MFEEVVDETGLLELVGLLEDVGLLEEAGLSDEVVILLEEPLDELFWEAAGLF